MQNSQLPTLFLQDLDFAKNRLNHIFLFFLLSSLLGEIQELHWKQPLKKVLCKNFTKLTGKHLCHSLFFNKIGGWELQLYLRDSGTCVFLWILPKFERHLLLQSTTRELILKIDILQNGSSTEYQADCMIKIFEKNWWRSSILVKLQAYSL